MPVATLDPYAPATVLHGCRADLWPPETQQASCTVCNLKPTPLQVVLDMGEQPLANALLSSPDEPLRRFPLQLGECVHCGHVQLAQTVRPDLMFDTYSYRTGISRTMREHFGALASWLRKDLGTEAKVCEVGCNDGTLLRALRGEGVEAYGVDPSSIGQSVADETILPRYFTERLGQTLRAERGTVDCVVMTNVLAHVPAPHELIRGAWELLREGGLLLAEFPYVRDLVENLAWDTAYHEHTHYFSLRDMLKLCGGKYWRADVTPLPHIHGGSLRFTARKTPYTWLSFWGDDPYWKTLTSNEARRIDWPLFAARAELHAEELRTACEGAKELVGYGCPAKATVLLNYTGIKPVRIVDDTPEKQGKWLPGVGCPIVPRSELGDPDRVLLLPWNFTDEIIAREPQLAGRWVVPMPQVKRC